jgi:hypothetical protein
LKARSFITDTERSADACCAQLVVAHLKAKKSSISTWRDMLRKRAIELLIVLTALADLIPTEF